MKQSINPIIIALFFVLTGSMMSYTFIHTFKPKIYQIGSTNGYDFTSPEFELKLPEILLEISGLTDIDNQTVACVQDEKGIVFLYDLKNNKIKKQFEFDKDGDYEGITRIGNSLYVLRSDGKLFEIDNYKNEAFKVNEYDTEIPVANNEGLGYDPINNRLLIAGKSEPKGDEYKDIKAVFAFDLNTKTASKKPVYEFSEQQIKEFVKKHDTQSDKNKDDEPKVKINPSGIAVHPSTGKLYVLSSKGNLIYIFNQNSEVETVHHLDKKMFNQPEGITFLDNGDMLISNEGGKEQPTILLFPFDKGKVRTKE